MCIRDRDNKQARAAELEAETAAGDFWDDPQLAQKKMQEMSCLLYTSDAADERSSVDLGGRRIIKKKKSDKSYACAADEHNQDV